MSNNQEFAKNRSDLNKCEKIYKWVSIAYICICIPSVFASIIFIFLSDMDPFGLFLRVLFKIAEFTTGYLGCYKKDSRLAVAEAIIALLNVIVCGIDGIVFLILSAAMCFLTVLANRKYEYLEQQEGFPYFNERFEKQKSDSAQFKIKSPYQQRYEEIIKNSSDSMDEI